MHKLAKNFAIKELLKPREELDFKSLSTLGWKLGKDFEAKTPIGEESKDDKLIQFSSYWMKNPSEEFYKEIILHEIAHAITDTIMDTSNMPHHNNSWRYIAKKLGCKYGAKVPCKKTIFGKSIIK